MIRITIDLSEPFEKILATALSLPRANHTWPSDAAIKRAVRYLYEAANGRTVETHIGAVPIAPPVEPSLRAKPLCLKSAAELVTMVKGILGASDSLECPQPEPRKPRQPNSGSALFEFMVGRLGAPECWPDRGNKVAYTDGAHDASRAISRWVNEGGKTLSARESSISRQHHCNRSK
jgi:hypothetical protein